ncbi:MAG TPA: twin-arginine translocase TatA/TatE family subunit [Gemmatimonadales bacterium]|jgi:sec-independent protein translocase protein TatA|nr:twin-arginine translocase TatA/TatE family subunit [Gemmatimonadales bacterium]
MFGDLSFAHILILLLVLVLVFGARRIPEIGSSIGQGIKEFKRSLKDVETPPTAPPGPPVSGGSGGDARSFQQPAAPGGGEPKRLSQ